MAEGAATDEHTSGTRDLCICLHGNGVGRGRGHRAHSNAKRFRKRLRVNVPCDTRFRVSGYCACSVYRTQWLRYRLDGTVEFELQYRPMYMYWFTYENP